MSNALAIASVTAVLKNLLNNGLTNQDISATVGSFTVSALSPDRIDITTPGQQSQLNLFLYQVTPNAGWRNVGLPSRNGNGERTSNPPLALNLHYLLTAYGALEFHAEILLGYGMQLLHEIPVLTRDAIRTSLAPPSPGGGGSNLPPEMQALFTSELAEQVEQIKIVPETLNSEEISRMWTAFQARYRPSAAYQASVVLIESKQTTRSPLPVRARNVYVVSFNQPVIDRIGSQATAGAPILFDQPILPGQNAIIAGRGLRADDVRVNVGGIEKKPADADVADTQIILPLPAELQAGIQGMQVIHRRLMGTPETAHRGFESNLASFVLRPRIVAINLANVQGTGANPRSADVELTIDPPVGDLQRVVLLLNELLVITSPPQEVKSESYSFSAPPRTTLSPPSGPLGSSNTITVPIKGVKAGTYLARVQIDGAESVLEFDAGGQFTAPKVVIA
jgi:Pvc16 N-terminal domain